MDVLTDWVKLSGVSGALLARSRMAAPWGMGLTERPEPAFHIVLEGSCWLRTVGRAPLPLHQGDLVLLSRGVAHELVHAPDAEAEPLESVLARLPLPPISGPATTVACGVYRFDTPQTQPLLQGLPEVLYFPATRLASEPSLTALLGMLTRELDRPGPGAEWLVPHLFDVMLVYLVRSWAAEATAQSTGWLLALRDPALARALTRMHAEPQAPWTVSSLAEEAGLSRAVFARRFTEQVGETPLAYLTRLRMGLASRLLHDTDDSLAQIASRVGYDSEFSFSRAFKRSRGQAPNLYRRQLTEAARSDAPCP